MALESETGSTLANGQANQNNSGPSLDARARAFGELFVQRRQRLGLTLQEVSSFTKLHPRFLKAIEQADFSKLPGGILTKSFIRSYAQEIGIDDSHAVSEYLAITGQAPPEPILEPTNFDVNRRMSATDDHTNKSHAGLLSMSLVVLLVIAASSGSFLLGRRYRGLLRSHAQQSHTAPSPTIDTQSDVSAKTEASPVTEAPRVPTGSPVTTASIQSPSTDASDSSSTSQSDQDLPPKTSDLTPTECSASTICVQVNARENAWVSISVDGKVIMQSTLVASTRKLIAAQRRLVIRAGNVGALDFRFNGVQLPAQGDYDQAKTLSFSPNGLESGAPASSPIIQTN